MKPIYNIFVLCSAICLTTGLYSCSEESAEDLAMEMCKCKKLEIQAASSDSAEKKELQKKAEECIKNVTMKLEALSENIDIQFKRDYHKALDSCESLILDNISKENDTTKIEKND